MSERIPLISASLNRFISEVENGKSLEKKVAQWAELYLTSDDNLGDYSEGLVLLKNAKQTYYESTRGGRFKRVFLRVFGKKEAQEKISDFTWSSHKNQYETSTSITSANWDKIGLYINAHRRELKNQASGQPILIHANPENHLPRSLVVTPNGEIFVLFNQTAEDKEDTRIGIGGSNHAKLAVNFDTGERKVFVTQYRKINEVRIDDNIEILRQLPKDSYFLQFYAIFRGNNKKANFPKYYMIMDPIEKTIGQMGTAERGYTEANRNIALSLLQSLTELHKNNLVHRDINPNNVGIVDDKGYLFDFDAAANSRGNRFSPYTPGYTTLWARQDWKKNDVYGLGIVLCSLLTGQDPRRVTIEELTAENGGTKPSPEALKNAAPRVQRKLHEIVDASANLPQEMKSLLKEMVGTNPGSILKASEAYQRLLGILSPL